MIAAESAFERRRRFSTVERNLNLLYRNLELFRRYNLSFCSRDFVPREITSSGSFRFILLGAIDLSKVIISHETLTCVFSSEVEKKILLFFGFFYSVFLSRSQLNSFEFREVASDMSRVNKKFLSDALENFRISHTCFRKNVTTRVWQKGGEKLLQI